MRFSVDDNLCTLCGLCLTTCPTDMVRQKGDSIKIGRVACIGCGHCLAVCPHGAVTLESNDYDEPFMPLPECKASAEAFLGLLRSRRTIRRYHPDPLPRETVEMLLEAGRSVPTAANGQCQEFTVITSEEQKTALRDGLTAYYREFAAALAEKDAGQLRQTAAAGSGEMHEHILLAVPALVKNMDSGRDRLFFDAPVVMIIHAAKNAVMPEAACDFAALAVSLMAEALGLGSCITGYASLGLQAPKLASLARELGIPEENTVYQVLAIGRPVERFTMVPPRSDVKARWLE